MKTKADESALKEIQERINKLEQQQDYQLTKEIMQESYEKRFNLLIHEIEESNENTWEKRETTLHQIHDFMRRGLQIQEPSSIVLADYHRLPQHPIYRNGEKVNRPIIIKLTNLNDKRSIFCRLKT